MVLHWEGDRTHDLVFFQGGPPGSHRVSYPKLQIGITQFPVIAKHGVKVHFVASSSETFNWALEVLTREITSTVKGILEAG